MKKWWSKDYWPYMLLIIGMALMLLILIIGLLTIDSFRNFDGNGFKAIQQYGLGTVLINGVARIQAGIILAIIIVPIIFVVTLTLSLVFFLRNNRS